MSILKGSLGFKGEKGDNGVSPTVEVSKVDGTATITITDIEGEHTTTVSDGEITKAMVIDDLTHTDIDKPLSANQGKVLKTAVDNCYTKTAADTLLDDKLDTSSIEVLSGTMTLNANSAELLSENLATSTTNDLTYPTGFASNNCVPIAVMVGVEKEISDGEGTLTYVQWCSDMVNCSLATVSLIGTYPRAVALKNDKIVLYVANYATSSVSNIHYKVVLMKVPSAV